MKRLTGVGEAPDRLDTTLDEMRGDLRAARETEDERIIAYIGGLDEER